MAEAWLNIGFIFKRQGDVASAQKIYQTGQTKCPSAPEFAERINGLSGHPRTGAKPRGYGLIDVDDQKFIRPPPETFAIDYVAVVPELLPQGFGIDVAPDGFKALATFPKSYFI
jgi:hypothetical protein